MPTLHLAEHQDSEPIELALAQRDQIADALPRAVIQPAQGSDNAYVISPKNYVGVIKAGGYTIEIAPKLDISRVLFLIAYALNPRYWQDHVVEFEDAPTLHEAIARPFADFTERATRRGPLHGYQSIDDSLPGVRGRIRFADQLRRHQRITSPIEVTYDEFTPDIEENRLLLGAIGKLLHLRFLTESTKQLLRRATHRLADVEHVRYDRRRIPNPQITRLNQHYERPLALARLILGDETIELSGQAVTSTGLLFDMANVFESFVHVALKEALGLSNREFPKNARGHGLYLDDSERIRLRPDLSWWDRGNCVMVGDVKYKKTVDGEGKEPDLYQLLAYTTATRVRTGFLVYAAGESGSVTHSVPLAGKNLAVTTLTLSNDPEAILAEIGALADQITDTHYQAGPALSAT
ncbi:MAG: restriction endonuclease [Gemmatimonadales bacterium]|nr:restriction endonuclease [Gemmatimonadales bacterium]